MVEGKEMGVKHEREGGKPWEPTNVCGMRRKQQ